MNYPFTAMVFAVLAFIVLLLGGDFVHVMLVAILLLQVCTLLIVGGKL